MQIENKTKTLTEVFGFDTFRPLQEQVINKILAKEDVLLILPTGGGKSLCYQLPAMLMDGVLVVVSPLLALMQDQVRSLTSKGIKAVMLSSLQSDGEISDIQNQLRTTNNIKALFVAPERLVSDWFLQFLSQIDISFFAIDEAHCVSEWGHEFRADYRQLSLLKSHFPNIAIAAFTATATKEVEADIVNQLNFNQSDNIIRGNVYRDNLLISVKQRQKNGYGQLLDFLGNHQNQSGIIYTLSRKNTEEVSDFLTQNGYKSTAYHAGLGSKQRHTAFEQFVNDDIDIVVATIAFGMGIDKSNIRFVAHLTMPKTMEAYYQEMGRAGRDGLASEVLLLYSGSDLGKLAHFINDIEDETYRNRAFDKLNLMKKYVFSEQCRHQKLSQYFDDDMPACKIQCDNCLDTDSVRTDISQQAQMFLSTVYRSKQQFGQIHIIDILLGSKNQKVLNNKHDKLSVYAIGTETRRDIWRIIADRLLEIQALDINEHKALVLTDIATKILKSSLKVDIRSNHLSMDKKSVKNKEQTIEQYPIEDEVFEQLRVLRKQIADEQNMPAYIIFDDKTLRQMGYFLPNTDKKLLQISGIGQLKLEKYARLFLPLLQQLRGADFAEKQPEIKAETKPKTSKSLHKTYQETLTLVKQEQSITEIAQQRDFTISTIIGHINKLTSEGEIPTQKRQELLERIPTNPALNEWIKQGLEMAGSFENIYHHLSVFKQLNDE